MYTHAAAISNMSRGNFYTIRPGDTLFSIGRRFNVSVDDLLEANPGIDPQSLRVGQIICIPVTAPRLHVRRERLHIP